MMQTNLLWTGIEYYSLENCLVNTTHSGTTINSVIVGKYHSMLYRVDYKIETNKNWETIHAEIRCQHNNHIEQLRFDGDGNGSWKMNGKPAGQFSGCIDIDIPLTPFTNTLPVNRLGLSRDETREIQVIYIDLLEQEIRPVKQKYTCLSPTQYQYENVPNDFEARIEVDEMGFVVNYPSLFVRTEKSDSKFQLPD